MDVWPSCQRKCLRAYRLTGTVTIIDPAYNLGIALLTNKKHTPVIDPEENPNVFEGDQFATSSYGSVITAIYEAME